MSARLSKETYAAAFAVASGFASTKAAVLIGGAEVSSGLLSVSEASSWAPVNAVLIASVLASSALMLRFGPVAGMIGGAAIAGCCLAMLAQFGMIAAVGAAAGIGCLAIGVDPEMLSA